MNSIFKRAVSVICLIALMTALGCGNRKDVRIAVKGNKTVGIRRGQLLMLELGSNPTTGYIWEITDSANDDILRRIGKYRYVRSSKRIGAGGVQIFRFEGREKGKAEFVFEYRRPWEKEEKPARKYTVRVFVH